MALRQGLASVSVRQGTSVFVTGSIVRGARMDWRGIWTGLDDADFDAFHAKVEWSASDELLGATLRRAVKATRLHIQTPAGWANGLWSDQTEFDQRLAGVFGSRSTQALYRGMRRCGVRWCARDVTLYPTRRVRGGQFERFAAAWRAGHEDIATRFSASDVELGAALRACIERCT